jgi:hypothetical protein
MTAEPFRKAIEWQVLAESGLAALESPAATSRRSFLKTVDGN